MVDKLLPVPRSGKTELSGPEPLHGGTCGFTEVRTGPFLERDTGSADREGLYLRTLAQEHVEPRSSWLFWPLRSPRPFLPHEETWLVLAEG